MFKSVSNIINSKLLITVLFNLLFVTFPFGANIFYFSIGFMTLYPFLICILLLTFIGFFHLNEIKFKIEKYSLIFIFIWFLYGLFSYFLVKGKQDALIDIRNLFLMLCTTFVFLWVKNFIGRDKWKKSINFGLTIVYIMLVLFSIYEVKTGSHFVGNFTAKILKQPNTTVAFAPLFVYDNPNNLTAYVILIGTLLILFSQHQKNLHLITSIIITNFFISHISSARTGIYICYITLIWFVVVNIKTFFLKLKPEKITYIGLLSFLLIITLIYKPQFPKLGGILPPNSIYKQSSHKVDENSTIIELKEVKYLNIDTLENRFSSEKIRLELALNGLEMIKNTKGIGVGAGQGRYLHKVGKVKFYTKTNIGFHFWLMEILSQYGVFIFLGYITLLSLILLTAIKIFKSNFYLSSLITLNIIVFTLASFLPSSFLILNINWIFMAILIGFVANKEKLIPNE